MPVHEPDARKMYGLTGGRHLDAISLNEKLTIYEKAVLHELANKMDVNGDFSESKWAYTSDLCRRTSMKRATLYKTIKSLEEQGYIRRHRRLMDDGSRNQATVFKFTAKLFREFQETTGVKLLKKHA